MTPHQLGRLCIEWQKRLRLQDWIVTTRLRDQPDMGDYRGLCHHHLNTKTAVIDISRQITDKEEVLVHELLHLHFAPFEAKENGTPDDVAQEQAIDILAGALVSLKYQRTY